jgi:hypothetical protein
MFRIIAAGLGALLVAQAGEIELPATALERDAPVRAIYRTNQLGTGDGTLHVRWTDVYGRLVEDRKLPFQLTDENEIRFDLDLRRAAAMKNTLEVRFDFEGRNQKGEKDVRSEKASVSFVARPPDRVWSDYKVIMWQNHPAERFVKLKPLGITGGMYSGRARTPPDFLLNNDLRWYAENIATDFYAEYHRYRPDRRPNWSFYEALELYKKDPTSKEAFKRHPSLSDPVWREKIKQRLIESARFHAPYRPIFYSLGDETGIADLTQYWDFDFSDHSLTAMREWLKSRYGTLAALNAQWETHFSKWPLVMPDTTNEAMKRTDDNFSSWSDHKEWMDIAFAGALKMGTDAIRSVDPGAYVSIGGAQMPGWGGYDYALLTDALTAMEPYDIGNNVEIIRSLNPKLPMVTTAFARGPWEKHRVWYELMHGSRGIILWDDKSEYVGKDLSIGDRGREAEPYYNEIGRGVGALLINSQRLSDPIAIHYSQPAMRINWMIEQRPRGEAWINRKASTERMDSQFMRLRESWCRLIEDLGLQYNFVSNGQLEGGELIRGGYRVLVLPRSYALSQKEAESIRTFVAQGGNVIADGEPGAYDEHSRKLPKGRLADLFSAGSRAILMKQDFLSYHQDRLVNKEGPVHSSMARVLTGMGVRPKVAVTGADGLPVVGVETHRYRNGGVEILGLLSNPQLRVNELGPPEFKSNERFEKPQAVEITLPATRHVYDIRAGKYLGEKNKWTVTIDPYEPVLYALSPGALATLALDAPARVRRGESAQLGVRFDGDDNAAKHVIRIDVADPGGKAVPQYSGNVIAVAGPTMRLLPFAANDTAGVWEIRAHDLLSGQTKTVQIELY